MTDEQFNDQLEENGLPAKVRDINAKIHKTDYMVVEFKINNLLEVIERLGNKLDITCSRVTKLESEAREAKAKPVKC